MRRLLKLNVTWKKNSYPLSFVDKQVKLLLENKMNEKRDAVNASNNVAKFYRLPLVIFQQMSNVRLIGFVNFIVKI